MTCTCPACRGLNDERYDDHEVEMQEIEVEVTFKEKITLDIPVFDDLDEEFEHIDHIVQNMYVDVELYEWKVY